MSAVLLPLAHHGLLVALPFVVPMVLVVGGLLFLTARDRLRGPTDADPKDPTSSTA
ncbi:MAG: hypothetical protein ACHQCI_04350 [Solirubrobacterales bacterium]|jgi:hypothetical protein